MSEPTRFTEEALRAQAGKKVPVTAYPGGPVIGEATLKYDPTTKSLGAEINVDDPEIAKLLRPELPPISFEKGE
jgi:hypothetical protein